MTTNWFSKEFLNPHLHSGYFTQSLESIDPQVFQSLSAEEQRQQEGLSWSPQKISSAVRLWKPWAPRLSTKPSRAIPEPVITEALKMQTVWKLAISRAKQLFECGYANVQPHSGSQANLAVFLAYLKPGIPCSAWTFPQEDTQPWISCQSDR